jgi:hypothetical protein
MQKFFKIKMKAEGQICQQPLLIATENSPPHHLLQTPDLSMRTVVDCPEPKNATFANGLARWYAALLLKDSNYH